MDWRKATYDTFEHKPPEQIVFQPRLEHWYNVNRAQGTLPEQYRETGLLNIYRDLGCSKRSYDLFNKCFVWTTDQSIRVEQHRDAASCVTLWHTPVGTMRQVEVFTQTAHQVKEFPVKTVDDLPTLEYWLRRRHVRFDMQKYEEAFALLGDLGTPTTWRRSQPIQLFFIEYMGFEETIFALYEHPAEMERAFEVIQETGWEHFDAMAHSPIRVLNLGDNVDCNMLCPPQFEKYALSYYRRIVELMHRSEKFVHPHWDGSVRTLLRYLRECGFDGVEALTPAPMGDVTLEEIRAAMPEEMILIDGIPATHFLPTVSYKELERFTRKLLDLFAPNLILGISDELPPPGDIEKVRMVAEIARSYTV